MSLRITRVYTKVGDRGTTRIMGGAELRKDDPRIEAYGSVDELNAALGVTRAEIGRSRGKYPKYLVLLDERLREIQNDLFNLGGDLATPEEQRWEGMRLVGEQDGARLEAEMDRMNAELPPLEDFILPGGGPLASQLHVCRTICRRAERRVVTLAAARTGINPQAVIFLNRLSDWFFVAARWVCQQSGEPETLWDRTR
jgi:cob(I)alamin adenosyltransferase